MIWNIANQIADGSVNGFHLLLFILLLLWSFHLAERFPGYPGSAGDENFYVKVDGGIRHAGVYSCTSRVTLSELIVRGGGLEKGEDIPGIFEDIIFTESAGVFLQLSGNNWKLSPAEIPAFNKITLGLPVSINSETVEGLSAIPGVGQILAGSIVQERDRRGGFKSIDELMYVHGIGTKKYRQIIQFVAL